MKKQLLIYIVEGNRKADSPKITREVKKMSETIMETTGKKISAGYGLLNGTYLAALPKEEVKSLKHIGIITQYFDVLDNAAVNFGTPNQSTDVADDNAIQLHIDVGTVAWSTSLVVHSFNREIKKAADKEAQNRENGRYLVQVNLYQ